MKKENIFPTDKNGHAHGFWVRYTEMGQLWSKRNWTHGNQIGYQEYHSIIKKNYIIKEYFII